MLLLDGLSDSQRKSAEPFTSALPDGRLVCRHTRINIQKLRADGVAAPLLHTGFEFTHPDPDFAYYKHQKHTAGFLAQHHRAWCLNGLRSGKTYSTIWAREILRDQGYHGKVLVLSPENVVNESWGDCWKLVRPDLNIYVSDKTVDHLRQHGLRQDTDVVVLNHGKLPYCVIDIDEWDPDFIIVDEGSVYKTPDKEPVGNLSFLAMNRTISEYQSYRPKKRWLWALSGSPRPSSGTDVWPLCRMINPELMPLSFKQWQRQVQTFVDVRDRDGKFQFRKWADRDEAEVVEACAKVMQPSIRYRTEDCVDMPPQAYSYFHTPPVGDQKTLYSMVARKSAGTLDEDKFRVVTTPNKVNKLMQIASGTAINTDGVWIDVGSKSRMDALLDLYRQADGKVVVFVNFVATAAYIQRELRKKHIKCDVINSTVSQKKRERIRAAFQSDRRKSVLVMHPKVTQFGTNVSAASVTIWWTPPMQGEFWIQGNERARAPGSTKTLIAMCYSTEAEREYYRRLQSKQRGNDKTIDFNAEFRKTRKVDPELERQFLQNWSMED